MTTLADRMKMYEQAGALHLTRRVPVVVRIDGRAFHTFTRGADKPYDAAVMDAMVWASKEVGRRVDGCRLVYTQSDEASFLLTDYERLETEPWFGYGLQKVVSVAASEFTAVFGLFWWLRTRRTDNHATFDARAFNIPEADVSNYFLWRAKDWHRNSVQMFAQAVFSPKELHGKRLPEIHEMLHAKGVNWATDTTMRQRNGTFVLVRHGMTDEGTLPTFEAVDSVVRAAMMPTADESVGIEW